MGGAAVIVVVVVVVVGVVVGWWGGGGRWCDCYGLHSHRYGKEGWGAATGFLQSWAADE